MYVFTPCATEDNYTAVKADPTIVLLRQSVLKSLQNTCHNSQHEEQCIKHTMSLGERVKTRKRERERERDTHD